MTANRVQPWLDDGDLTLYHGDALTVLQALPAGIAQTCVTSPPYWGLRDYQTGTWSGGDEACDHLMPEGPKPGAGRRDGGRSQTGTFNGSPSTALEEKPYVAVCGKCGARRVDSQLGLEATPTLYVENMVNLFREVWRVLRDDGTLWLNLGDSYVSNGFYPDAPSRQTPSKSTSYQESARGPQITKSPGLKTKDLVGIPWRVAFALQADGWYLRSDIIWSKPNPMPESVTDRPTKAHEYLFLFSKQPRYFYDADAIREANLPESVAHHDRFGGRMTSGKGVDSTRQDGDRPMNGGVGYHAAGRNRRSVWVIPTQPFPEAHFATYPEELVRPCILAGTSEKGECSTCGKPWIRQTEAEYVKSPVHGAGSVVGRHYETGANGWDGSGMPRLDKKVTTTGWEPSCSCLEQALHDDPTPEQVAAWTRRQLVLDPFIGSGTTSLVARKHGRRSIGIDLSAEYLAIAAKRTQQLSLLGGPAEPAPRLEPKRGLTGGAYSPPGQSPHSNARDGDAA